MITYVKIIGPPLLKALKALEKIAVDQPEVCIMDTLLTYEPNRGMDDTMAYFGSFAPISEERCGTIISKSGIGLGEYDFYYEWFKEPSNQEFVDFIEKIDEALQPIGVNYSLTSKGARRLKLDLSDVEIKEIESDPDVSVSGGYFEVYRGKDGQWRFRLKAGNHRIIAVSEAYTSKAGCMNGIRSVKENSKNSEIYDLTE